jgi:signal transduction histidine kinase
VRLRFALAAALPALLSLAIMALLGDRLARRALEEELGARLVAVAQAAAAALPAERAAGLAPGDEGTRTFGHLRGRLEALARATSTRLVVARLDRTALCDSEGRHAIGDPLPALERDRFELSEVAAGRAAASQVLFEGADGELYKTGYAPLIDAGGQVVALVAAAGTAPSFATLRAFRTLLGLLALGGAVLGALVAVAAALSVTRPLHALAAAARRMGAGDLDSPLPAGTARGEVETLRATLEEMRQALRARDREREAMLAGIAHEVRNPLGAMSLYAGALADDLADRPEAAHVARIRQELGGLSRLVEDFLDYARHRAPDLEPVDAARLAEEVRELCQPVADGRGVALQAGGAGAFEADRHLLRRAALNLVRNAVEASPAGAAVELRLAVEGEQAVLTVLDRGPGLPAEARARLFEPFCTTKPGGTGLGLALARKGAQAHGGALTVGDRVGGGTAARLTIPRGGAPLAPPPGAAPPERG